MDKVLVATAGAAIGWILAWIKSYADYLSQRKRELYVAALGCRDRLGKISYAVGELDDGTRHQARDEGWRPALASLRADDWRRQTTDNELGNLGADLDRYREAIAPIRSTRVRETHLHLYDELTALLITHDLDQIGRLSNTIEDALRRLPFLKRRP